jgi:predicted Zn-dependent protease
MRIPSYFAPRGRVPPLLLLALLGLAACQSFQGPLPPQPQHPPPASPEKPQPPEQQQPEPHEPTQPQRQFRLSAASTALVSQAEKQARSGDSVAATATLERALRIEPDNPLLWIELGQLRLQEKNAAQAQSLGRKALSLATGDPRTQSSAWRLIADALRAQGRNHEARDAEEHADALSAPLSGASDDADAAEPDSGMTDFREAAEQPSAGIET